MNAHARRLVVKPIHISENREPHTGFAARTPSQTHASAFVISTPARPDIISHLDNESNVFARTMSAENELSSILNRRQQINEALENGEEVKPKLLSTNIYNEFTRKQVKEYQTLFNKYDTGKDGFLDLLELKYMMEKLDAPQTHLTLKNMIAEIDEDNDGKISFREFLLIFKKARAGEFSDDSGLGQLARLSSIDVDDVGVVGAKNFFEAKIEEQLKTNKFHDEIRQEQLEKRQAEIERDARRQQFQERAAMFGKN